MEEALLDILRELERTEALDERALTKLINRHNKRLRAEAQAEANEQGNATQTEARDDAEHARKDAAEAASTAHAAAHSKGAAKCRTGEGEPGPHGTTHTDTRPCRNGGCSPATSTSPAATRSIGARSAFPPKPKSACCALCA